MKILVTLLITTLTLCAGIVNTPHNFSSMSGNSIKAQSELETCVFCHIPHGAQSVGKPLWNRAMPTTQYKMYSSVFLNRMGYGLPTQLGSQNNEPGALSRQCLSCHDGTVAVGAIFKLRRQNMDGQNVPMVGLNADGTLSDTSSAFIGGDLSNHHPVGVEYNPFIGKNFGIGRKSIELRAVPTGSAKLFNYGGKQYVECSTCHDPHTENKKFLRGEQGINHAVTVRNLCVSCHDKDSGTAVEPAHKTMTSPYSDPEILAQYQTQNPADLYCINCHTPHNGKSDSFLLREIEENTCFKGAASHTGLASCHGSGSGGGPDIESVLRRSYGHPVIRTRGVHTGLDSLHGNGNLSGDGGVDWDTSKHAECVDCHNPHKAGKGTHVPDGQWYPTVPTNRVSPALAGVSGIEPNWTPRGIQPTEFTTLAEADYEYQICLKCHSYWGLGDAPEGLTQQMFTGGAPVTDQAWEFNNNNRSAHPVVMSLNSRPGSVEPKGLRPENLLSPWNAAPGMNTMYCSDCHGADNELNGDPRGPHGSNIEYLLKGDRKSWIEKPDGELYKIKDIYNGGDADLFCANCHDLTRPQVHAFKGGVYGNFYGDDTMTILENTTCVTCHVAIPHGSKLSRLIGYKDFPAPYNYNGNSLKVEGYKKSNNVSTILPDYAYATDPNCIQCHDVATARDYETP